ncbi:MAG: hypothetical protein R6U58_13210 [Bacteroidales bacterium]
MRIKIEPYYQILQDIPVYPNSSFSIINVTSYWAVNRQLENTGTGRNYGIDVTIERFLKDGYYYLIIGSLFDSKYVGGDGKEYSTRFNRGYVLNLLAGKEWMVKDKNYSRTECQTAICSWKKTTARPIYKNKLY